MYTLQIEVGKFCQLALPFNVKAKIEYFIRVGKTKSLFYSMNSNDHSTEQADKKKRSYLFEGQRPKKKKRMRKDFQVTKWHLTSNDTHTNPRENKYLLFSNNSFTILL